MKNAKSTTPAKEKDYAQTPQWFIASLCSLLGIKQFDLDVCALESTKKAEKCYSLDERGENGLFLLWEKWNWCNPPFSDITPFLEKAHAESSLRGGNTAVIMPASTETKYVRFAKEHADTIIEMPFRLQFLKPDGSKFLSKKTGKPQSPEFSCLVAIFTPLGLRRPTAHMNHDFREGFYEKNKR